MDGIFPYAEPSREQRFGHVVPIERRDVPLVGERDRFLGLNDLDVVGDAGGQTIARLFELLARKLTALGRYLVLFGRSLQIEVSIDNRDGRLLPGAYIDVSVPVGHNAAIVIPVNTLLLRGEGARVAVVDEKGVVKLHPVELGKDFGQKIEVLSGVTVDDRLVLNPPDSLSDGDQLTIVEKKENEKSEKAEKKS